MAFLASGHALRPRLPGRIGANAICGKAVAANYFALPRAVYTDAGVCSIGIGFGAAMKVGVETEESQTNSS